MPIFRLHDAQGTVGDCSAQPDPAAPCSGPAPLSISYYPGQSLAAAVYLSGKIAPVPLCSGMALCGRCRMRILSPPPPPATEAERHVFSKEERALGWRLACRQQPAPGMLVETPDTQPPAPAPIAKTGPAAGFPAGKPEALPNGASLLAVDLGTTTLHWRIVSREGCLEGRETNPQAGAGSDVMARIAAALTPHGAQRLHELTLAALQRIALAGAQKGLPPPEMLCLAANPAMTALCLGKSVRGLAAAPYGLPLAGGSWENLPGLPRLWVPPLLSPFVGGDVSAGYAFVALGQTPPDYPFVLCDMGTNGEFLLALSPEESLVASVALGPALEGSGLRHGSAARPGAINDFTLSPQGLSAHVIGHDAPVGITGTGYLALLARLKTVGALSPDGLFTPESAGLFRRCFTPQTHDGGEAFIPLPHGMRLYASDIETTLKVKAAFSLGLERLLASAGIPSSALARVYLAGALGAHVDASALETLGFFPQGMAARIHSVGNSALEGAVLLAASGKTRDLLQERMRGVHALDLAADPAFAGAFAAHMRFMYT